MNRVAYILNGALYINHLPPQKFLDINPVILNNSKDIAKTGGEKHGAIKENFLEGHMRVMKRYSSSKCMHGSVRRKLASARWPPLHPEQCSSIPRFSPCSAAWLLLSWSDQIPLLDICMRVLSASSPLRGLPARAAPFPRGCGERCPHNPAGGLSKVIKRDCLFKNKLQ